MDKKQVLKWLGRISGFLICGFFLAFMIGEGVPEIAKGADVLPILPILIMLSIALAGYVVAWFYERTGGAILIVAALTMAVYHFYIGGIENVRGALIYGLPFLIVGIIFFSVDSLFR